MSRFCLLALLLALPALTWAQSASTLVVNFTELRSQKGALMISLHNRPEGFPGGKQAIKQTVLKLGAAAAQIRFADLAPGRYAVAVIHDENDNRKMDTSFLGLPKEGWGTTRDPRPAMRGPRYEEAVIDVAAGEQTVTIRLKY